MTGRLRRCWDTLSLYLPVLLMGVLALGTWWLVRNAPAPLPLGTDPTVRHEPDYTMKQFAVKSFDGSGRLQSVVQGDVARHYPDTDTLEIDAARLRSVSADGRVTTATSHRALSNADGSEVQLFGDAVVVREASPARNGVAAQPALEFRSEFLHAYTRTERMKTHLPVVLTRGNDRMTADGLEYDNIEQILRLKGQVRGVLQPAANRK